MNARTLLQAVAAVLAVCRPFAFAQPGPTRSAPKAGGDLQAVNPRDPAKITGEHIAACIEAVLTNGADRAQALQILQAAGERARPALLAALDDPRAGTLPSRDQLAPGVFVPETPFDDFAFALARLGSPELSLRLQPLLESPDARTRERAVTRSIHAGNDGWVALALDKLKSPDQGTRDAAWRGVTYLLYRPNLTPEHKAGAFEVLATVAAGEVPWTTGGYAAPETMFRIDPVKAAAVLNSQRVLRPDNKHLSAVVAALNEHEVRIPIAALERLLAEGEKPQPDPQKRSPASFAFADCVVAVAYQDGARARPMIEKLALQAAQERDDFAGETAFTKAAAALLASNGLVIDPAVDLAFDPETLGPERRAVYALWALNAEVENGGLSQYFFNSTGDSWPRAIEGFKQVGATNAAAILTQAVKLFPEPPSTDRDKRIDQLDKLPDAKSGALSDLDDTYYGATTNLAWLVAKYMVSRKDLYAGVKAPPPTAEDP